MSYIKYMISIIQSRKEILKLIIVYGGMSVFSYAISLYTPFLQSNYIDRLISSTGFTQIEKLIYVIITISILSIGISYISSLIMTKLSSDLEFKLISLMIKHIHKLPILKVINYNAAYLNQRVNEDSSAVVSFFLANFINFPLKWVIGIFQFYIIYKLSFKFFIIALFFIPCYILIYSLTQKKIYEKNYNLKEVQNKYYNTLYDQFHFIKEIKLSANFNANNKRTEKSYKNYFNTYYSYGKYLNILGSLDTTILNVFNIILLIIGATEYFNKIITIGEITLLTSYFGMISGTVNYYVGVVKSYQSAKVSYDRLKELNNFEEERNGDIFLNSIDSIKVDDLSFGYSEKNILQNMNCEFNKGNIYVIVGDNGTGKTTFINILTGIIKEGVEGSIWYNNYLLNDLDMYKIRLNKFYILPQSESMQSVTVEEMLKMNLNLESKEDFDNFMSNNDIRLVDYGNDFKIEKYLNRSMITLSGGEAKKSNLLVSIYKDCEIMILDEPTNELDTKGVEYFKDVLQHMKKDRIIILITHDKNMLNIADKIIDFNQL